MDIPDTLLYEFIANIAVSWKLTYKFETYSKRSCTLNVHADFKDNIKFGNECMNVWIYEEVTNISFDMYNNSVQI